jgi:hypothetical protein
MKDPDFAEQHNGNSTASPLPPWQAATDRPSEDQLKGALVLALNFTNGATDRYQLRGDP